jgi:hypothetical protein
MGERLIGWRRNEWPAAGYTRKRANYAMEGRGGALAPAAPNHRCFEHHSLPASMENLPAARTVVEWGGGVKTLVYSWKKNEWNNEEGLVVTYPSEELHSEEASSSREPSLANIAARIARF